ncbi:YnbE family lipoprotein [Altererythrobacter sp. C41]|uniref:YnbE family lipoprotein n=1 Tax=Altererythrobacter sp. C41 TaxID=2806021 RepID=UPI001EE3B7E3|nr:YnbE family lipoprotein [Altererythrobacter sp. C41]
MTSAELTARRAAARTLPMQGNATAWKRAIRSLPLVVAGLMTLAGCISVEAPDKPIVIELNINIRQEVIYRLAEDAGNTIEENADIF